MEVKWIKITTSMFDDEKIKIIESMPDRDAILIIWIKLLTLAGKCNTSGCLLLSQNIPYSDEMLSTVFSRPISTIRLALDTFYRFGMIEMNESTIHIANWEKHQNIEGLERIREQNRIRKQKQREREKILQIEAPVQEELIESQEASRDITLQNKKENKKKINTYSAFFESVWKLYPNKKGKAQISDTTKKKLEKVGYETLEKCIKRYTDTKEDWKKWQNGSTFFNGGYVDYLDENFQERVEVSIYREE